MYSTTTFYDTDDLTAKAVGDFLLKKYTDEVGEEALPTNINYVYYHTEVKREFLSDIISDIPQLGYNSASIDVLTDAEQLYFKQYMILRNIELIFLRCEDYDMTTATQYKQMYDGFVLARTKEYNKVKKYIRRILGVESCIQVNK